MKIYLFMPDRIIKYNLPSEISGSFSFDPDIEEESKLINIESNNYKWIIKSTNDVIIYDKNTTAVENLVLENDQYFYLKKNKNIYPVYIETYEQKEMDSYQYTNLDIRIGNTEECNIKYNFDSPYRIESRLYTKDNNIILEKRSESVYLNNKNVENKEIVNIGDCINIYGLRLVVLKNIILIYYEPIRIKMSENNENLIKISLKEEEKIIDIKVKDEDLYKSSDYFSKAPRLRRKIDEKKIKLDNPPQESNENEVPLILVIGPMLTMGGYSAVTLINVIYKINIGETYLAEQWSTILMCIIMLTSMIIWPFITQLYNKYMKKKKKKELKQKYNQYLDTIREDLEKEKKLQKEILVENLITTSECANIIKHHNAYFWNKRIDQSDFLTVRIGMGNEDFKVKIEYPEKGFSIEENELELSANKLVEESKFIENVPVHYSLFDNKITAIMGTQENSTKFINSILLQLLAFYTYEDIKIVMITNETNEKEWEYIKYLNHNFDNTKSIRFFATNPENTKDVLDYLTMELKIRKQQETKTELPSKPYYIVIIDDYTNVKTHDFIKEITDYEEKSQETDLGFSIIIKENLLKKLPSKCNNFIILNEGKSGLLKSSYEEQKQIEFYAEYLPENINLMQISRELANIPIEFEETITNLPETISFLEMEKVGKVEQLNIQNRWNTNDSTLSLKAEIGIDNQENIIYLDLHEKNHGPHGLIAGTTGSGKSEFIITYILSMCINYSPNDISFILIDYKGGGLTLAFENKTNDIILPHLAGTITNLDASEIGRTLLSINSEAKRRQELFNIAKDTLGESTMDIYKYQKYYHEGRLKEPITHLFIICDEFAELKAEQPDFMDDLISIARIGRSLGVHLILATQKPSGIVNDQIWSNTRFRVCLKVQDEADSKEMLKKPDAAHLSQTGRFYLQVGYDELYILGQSSYSGATYFPSDKIIKQIDKSINFIDNIGRHIKSVQASQNQRLHAQGEQLQNILKEIIKVSDKNNITAKKLWLASIPEIITEEELAKKYQINHIPYVVEAIIGEYDAPEKQEQGIVKYNFLQDGNTIIYGNDGTEREMLINAIIYSTCKYHAPEEINFYIIDYGSEATRKYKNLPQVGDIILQEDEEKYNNCIKYIKDILKQRKKVLADYNGDYKYYIENTDNKLPIITIIFNNYDSILENDSSLYEIMPEITRDSDKYGVNFILTGNTVNSINTKISTNFSNIYAFKLKDNYDYRAIFNNKKEVIPSSITGRGIFKKNNIYEFQTLSISKEDDDMGVIKDFIDNVLERFKSETPKIPTLPEVVNDKEIEGIDITMDSIPIGISKKDLEIKNINLTENIGYLISSNKRKYTNNFVKSLVNVSSKIINNITIIIDPLKELGINDLEGCQYFTDDLEEIIENLVKKVDYLISKKSDTRGIIFINGIDKTITSLSDSNKFNEFMDKIKEYENISVVVIDDENKIKSHTFENWFKDLFSLRDAIWIGNGIVEQSLLRISIITKELNDDVKINYGYILEEGEPILVKLIDLYSKEEDQDE